MRTAVLRTFMRYLFGRLNFMVVQVYRCASSISTPQLFLSHKTLRLSLMTCGQLWKFGQPTSEQYSFFSWIIFVTTNCHVCIQESRAIVSMSRMATPPRYVLKVEGNDLPSRSRPPDMRRGLNDVGHAAIIFTGYGGV